MKKIKLLLLGIVLCLPFLFLGCSKEKKETLQTPMIVDVEDGIITFSKISNADYYTVLLNDVDIIIDHNFNQNVKIVDDSIQFDANSVLIDGTNYTIKVKANSKKITNSKFSTSFEYQHGENIPTPINATIFNSTLIWDNVSTASYYLVKVVTPSDNAIFDKSGNLISIESSSDIANAQLSEYICNTNSFPITDFVNTPGEYSFYVASVFAEGGKVTISKFSEKQTYIHSATLTNPTNLTLTEIGGKLYLTCVIDKQANAISIKAGTIEKTAELNNSNSSITELSKNYLNIDLNSFFATEIANNDLNLNTKEFEIQSKYISNQNNNVLTNSNYTKIQHVQPKQCFVAPQLSLQFNSYLNKYVASWTNPNIEKTNYTLIVFGKNGIVSKKTLSSSTTSLIIEQDFISLAIMLNENNNFKNSALSNFVSKSDTASSSIITECVKTDNTLFWSSITNAYYVVETNNDYYICTNNSMNYDNENSLNESIKITAIIDGFKHTSKSFNLTNIKKLATPEIINITSGKNNCKILLNPVSNAIGYYVYVKDNNDEFVKIDYLFTDTLLNLSYYLNLNSTSYNFEVKIQAAGAYLSSYQSSELSDSLIISTAQQHVTPSFVFVNNIEIPIFKIVENNKEKYILKFMGVKDTAQYQVHINNYSFRIHSDIENEQKLYEYDVSSYITSVGKYVIKIKAISSKSNFTDSEYNIKEYVVKKQLDSVQRLELNQSQDDKILTFSPVQNAKYYTVRIVKDSDLSYVSKLQQKGLSSTFKTTGPIQINDYLTEQGTYHIYIAAIAGSNSEFYYDSDETKIIFKVE